MSDFRVAQGGQNGAKIDQKSDQKSVDPSVERLLDPLDGGRVYPPPYPPPCWTPPSPDDQKHVKTRIKHKNMHFVSVLRAASQYLGARRECVGTRVRAFWLETLNPGPIWGWGSRLRREFGKPNPKSLKQPPTSKPKPKPSKPIPETVNPKPKTTKPGP